MDTVIVELYLPGVNQSRDFVLPAHIPVGNLLDDLIEAARMGTGSQIDKLHPCLVDMGKKRPLPYQKTLSECGIRDSSKLMLV